MFFPSLVVFDCIIFPWKTLLRDSIIFHYVIKHDRCLFELTHKQIQVQEANSYKRQKASQALLYENIKVIECQQFVAEAQFYAKQRAADAELYAKKREAEGLT